MNSVADDALFFQGLAPAYIACTALRSPLGASQSLLIKSKIQEDYTVTGHQGAISHNKPAPFSDLGKAGLTFHSRPKFLR